MEHPGFLVFVAGSCIFVWLIGRQLTSKLKGPRKVAAWALFIFLSLPTLAFWGFCSWLLDAMFSH
jgi:hypothetical protein